MTFNRFLYAVLESESERLGIKIAHLVNMTLSEKYEDKIELLRLQERSKYS